MPLQHYTERHFVRLLATETRRTDISPHALSLSHSALGRFLASELVEHLPLEPHEIPHPQGRRQGWRIANEQSIALVVFMRAGLYIADGIREIIQFAPILHVSPQRNIGLNSKDLSEVIDLAPQNCVFIDSVVNTGASLEPVLEQFSTLGPRLFVLSLVSPVSTAERLAQRWPNVHFLFARISENQYVGKGNTDTGNRLFGTIHS